MAPSIKTGTASATPPTTIHDHAFARHNHGRKNTAVARHPPVKASAVKTVAALENPSVPLVAFA